MRVAHPEWMDHKWQHYWRADEEGHADCGIFYERRPGQAYALLRAPKYITHEEWDEIAEHVVAMQASHKSLVNCCKQLHKWIEAQGYPIPKELDAALKLAKP